MSDTQQSMDDEKNLFIQQSVNTTPAIEGLERPATVFLSYAREDTEAIGELQLRLNVRGVVCWRDADDLLSGSLFEGEIIQAIKHDADAVAILLTPISLTSDFIWNTEIPVALERQAHDPHFHVVPILQDVSFKEVEQRCSDRNLPDLTRFQAIELTDDGTATNEEGRQARWNEAARLILKSALAVRLRRVNADRNRSYEPWISLKTFASTPPTVHLDLDLDWLKVVYEKERLPTPQEWKHVLLPALRDVKQSISEKVPSRRIHVLVQSILPIAIALGFIFRKTARITLLIEGQQETWSSGTQSLEKDPLHVEWLDTGQGDQREAVIAVNAARNRFIRQSVVDALPVLNLTPGYHAYLSHPASSSTGMRDAVHAQAIAEQVGQVAQELSDLHRVKHIHLFIAAPVELAVLIGHQLNALCPITLYEYAQGTYTPVGTLESKD